MIVILPRFYVHYYVELVFVHVHFVFVYIDVDLKSTMFCSFQLRNHIINFSDEEIKANHSQKYKYFS